MEKVWKLKRQKKKKNKAHQKFEAKKGAPFLRNPSLWDKAPPPFKRQKILGRRV